MCRCIPRPTRYNRRPPSEKRNSVRALRLTPRNPAGLARACTRSVYGVFPESGCLSRRRFCKFTSVDGSMGQSSAANFGIRAGTGLAILASGQWWRLLGGLRPSEAPVFVCRVGAREKPEKNQDRCGNNATAGACDDQIAHSVVRPGARKPLAVASDGNTRRLIHRFSRNESCAPQNAREGMR